MVDEIMKRKPGRPKKEKEDHGNGQEEENPETEGDVLSEPADRAFKFREREDPSIEERIAESRKALEHPITVNQMFFESPEGEIIIADKDKDRVWARTMNNGKGGWANPRR